MPQILRLMRTLKHGLRRLRLRKICLTIFILLELGCAGLPPFPAKYLYEADLGNKVCGRYVVTDTERLLFQHDADLPLSQCDGVFGFSRKDISPVLNWSRDMIQYGKGRCK